MFLPIYRRLLQIGSLRSDREFSYIHFSRSFQVDFIRTHCLKCVKIEELLSGKVIITICTTFFSNWKMPCLSNKEIQSNVNAGRDALLKGTESALLPFMIVHVCYNLFFSFHAKWWVQAPFQCFMTYIDNETNNLKEIASKLVY